MEAKAHLRYARISPRKVQIVCDLIRGKSVAQANAILMGTPKAASELLLKLLKSAASNAENNHQMDPEKLYVSQVFACPGPIIKRMMPRAQIVFATAYSQYAVKAFELGVNNYILKPFDPERVRRVLEKCRKDLESSSPAQPAGRLAISSDRKIVLLDISRIVYVETCGRSCLIHTTEGDYTENQLLGEYEKRLSPQGFFRIHKSYLVNLNYISEMFPWANNSLAVKMQGFEKNILPVSREKVKNLRQLLGL